MVEAMIAGERNPDVLAGLARGRMRARIPDLSEALAGRFAAHHGVVARQILDHITFLDDSIAQLSAEVAARCAPFAKALDLLISIPGISRLTAEVFLAETGGDMSRFPSAGHLAAWAGVAPANAESAGKRHAAGTRQGARWLRRALVESAKAASHGKDTYLAAQYRRIARRRGPNKATVAVAHSIIVAAWHVLTNGEPYTDPGGDYFERRESSAARARRLVSQLEALGHRVTLTPAA